MPSILTLGAAIAVIVYLILKLLLLATQDSREPQTTESKVPFLDSMIGILRHRADYLSSLGYVVLPNVKVGG